MSLDPTLRLTNDESHEFFAKLFPNGLAGEDVLAELAPAGWASSPLSCVFHPSSEQIHEESVRMRENLREVFKSQRKSAEAEESSKPSEPPTLEQVRSEYQPRPLEPEREVRELVGMCLWDIFSDNHEVFAPDGRVVDLGSFRASGGFIAEVVNRGMGVDPGAAEEREMARLQRMIGIQPSDIPSLLAELAAEREQADRIYDYLDFYMGTQTIAHRADLTPVYNMIFRRLRLLDCDWQYHFPRLLLVDLRPLGDALKENDAEPAWANYDPSSEFAKEQADQERNAELAKMRAEMAKAHREAVDAAQSSPPPMTVAAYLAIFGYLPEGWPPHVED